jgi:hypothetical protein
MIPVTAYTHTLLMLYGDVFFSSFGPPLVVVVLVGATHADPRSWGVA